MLFRRLVCTIAVVCAAVLSTVSCSSEVTSQCTEESAERQPLPPAVVPDRLAEELGTDVEHVKHGFAGSVTCSPAFTADQLKNSLEGDVKMYAEVAGRATRCAVLAVPYDEMMRKQAQPDATFNRALVVCAANDEELESATTKTT